MPQVNCRLCKKPFYAKPHWLKKGWGKYCSLVCERRSRKNGRIVACFLCRKKIYRQKRFLNRSKSKKYFCSRACQLKWRHSTFTGSSHANWRHGENAYKNMLLRSRIPPVCRLCCQRDLQVLVVHHFDQNRKNNKLKNLCWLCHNCHFLVHHYNTEKERLTVSIA